MGIIGALDYGFFAWSTRFAETAIVTTVYELWPVILVYFLIRYQKKSQSNDTKVNFKEQLSLSLLAAVGLTFMLASQSSDSFWRFYKSISLASISGVALAFVSAILASSAACGILIYGDKLFQKNFNREPDSNNRDDRMAQLWFTLIGFAICTGSSPIFSLGMGFFLPRLVDDMDGKTTSLALMGSICVGIIGGVAAILLSYGNVTSRKPGVNAIFFTSPAIALLWLALIGITISRMDLFIIGAALILTINILLNAKPDEERDLSKFKKDTPPGTRLGFTAFIMSIWVFGTFLYLRDEMMPNSRFVYSISEYWSLIALSATVFALILGFRIARLSARINKEDETILSLFRDSEHLVRRQIFDDTIKNQLAELDTSKPKDLRDKYSVLREQVKVAMEQADDADDHDKDLLLSVEKELDMITHSKQQGRDIVELLSLAAFAGVTIGLGLWTRPKGLKLGPPQASWSGFLSEVFVLLFVSTIAFLCINLFDIRRERETPLLVSFEQRDGNHDYQLFFRHKQDLKAQHFIAALISIAMSITFGYLLYHKWI